MDVMSGTSRIFQRMVVLCRYACQCSGSAVLRRTAPRKPSASKSRTALRAVMVAGPGDFRTSSPTLAMRWAVGWARALGRRLRIDDWAWRKGPRYGTLICDLERRAVIDLLPDREPATVAARLR